MTTDNGGSGESDLVNVHVGRDGSSGNLSETRDDVDDSWWETGLLDETGGEKTGKWGLLGSLEDDGVTTGDGWTNLP